MLRSTIVALIGLVVGTTVYPSNGYVTGDLMLSLTACRSGFTEVSSTAGRYLIARPTAGTLAGTTGSAMTDLADASYTPAGSVAAPALSGSVAAESSHTHSVTSNVTLTTGADSSTTGGVAKGTAVTNNAVTSGAGSSHLHAVGTLAAAAPAFTGSATATMRSAIAPGVQVVVCQKN